jgi:hypothetical protein
LRRADWVSRLIETVAAHKQTPFSYGEFDCAIFAARCVDAITGSEWERSLGYSDIRSAARVRRNEGGLEAGVSRRLGNPVPGCGARRGDVCLLDQNTLGVSLGSQVAVLSDQKIVFYPITRARKHWRVD